MGRYSAAGWGLVAGVLVVFGLGVVGVIWGDDLASGVFLPVVLGAGAADMPTATAPVEMTATATGTSSPTGTPSPTKTLVPTNTVTATVQPATPTATATKPAPPGGCSICSYDAYNCSDFGTQAQAQACFDYCYALVGYDVHRLDADNNGVACESLPVLPEGVPAIGGWVLRWR